MFAVRHLARGPFGAITSSLYWCLFALKDLLPKMIQNRPPFGHASDGCRKGRLSKRRREGTEERRNE